MSAIIFHGKSDSVEVSGSERAYANLLVRNLGLSVLDPFGYSPDEQFQAIFTPEDGRYLEQWNYRGFPEALSMYMLPAIGTRYFVVEDNGARDTAWHISLNTAIALGNEPIKLLARLDAQCEMHCYVEEENRNWLASVIEDGIRLGIMRTDFDSDDHRFPRGWKHVVRFLRTGEDGPVVCSYSVTDEFPNRHIAHWPPEGFVYPDVPDDYEDSPQDWRSDMAQELWYDMGEDERWELGMAGVRADSDNLELTPDTLDNRFGLGFDAFDLRKRMLKASRERQDKKLKDLTTRSK